MFMYTQSILNQIFELAKVMFVKLKLGCYMHSILKPTCAYDSKANYLDLWFMYTKDN